MQFLNDMDYLTVYDGGSNNSNIISNITNKVEISNIFGTGNRRFILLKSNGLMQLSINIKFEICKHKKAFMNQMSTLGRVPFFKRMPHTQITLWVKSYLSD